jgi:hypothetical protein
VQTIIVDVANTDPTYSTYLTEMLERGNILILEKAPFIPSDDDMAFMRGIKQTAFTGHKNIAFKPNKDKVTGTAGADSESAARLKAILMKYSKGSLEFLTRAFPRYASVWKVDYATYRPVEEEGRVLPMSHRNDLLHVDAFPTRPTHGGRILRCFTNLHPSKERVWGTSGSFDDIAKTYAMDAGLGKVSGPIATAKRAAMRAFSGLGLKIPNRSAYDDFMIGFHHYLKSNEQFQRDGRKYTTPFGPGATWISYTDQIAHCVLSGQFAMEQTCIVPFSAMLKPELAPLSVLEKLAGRQLVEVKMRSAAPLASTGARSM